MSRDEIAATYPLPPWRLRGTLWGSVWLVPEADAPRAPEGTVPLRIGGRPVVVTGWADYAPGGVLAYREALCGVAIRRPQMPALAITHIWVDHPASVAGGRALWGIPKRMGAFAGTPEPGAGDDAATVADRDGRPIAGLRFRPGPRLPWRFGTRFRTVQTALRDEEPGNSPHLSPHLSPQGAADLLVATMRIRGRAGIGRAEWWFAPDGPLPALRGRRPLVSLRMTDAALDFGL